MESFTSSMGWLFFFVACYWAYCIFWGVKGARSAKTASDYFIAGRSIGIWVFVLAATATSFSGWTFVGHPALVWKDGLPYGYASFYAITIPLTGVVFLKRQWLLGKRFGFITPGEMYSTYFNSNMMRYLTVLVALVFSVPYLGIQLRASGFLFNVLTDGLLDVNVGMLLLSAVVILYVALGGLRSVAYVDTAQCVLLAFGIIAIGLVSLSFIGGMGGLKDGLAKLARGDYAHVVTTTGMKVKIFNPEGADITGSHYEDAIKGFLDSDGKKLVTLNDAASGNVAKLWKTQEMSVELNDDGSLPEPVGVGWQSKSKATPTGASHFITIPGAIQFVTPGTKAVGGVWTGMMILTYMFALMGIQSAPAFSMWAFSNKNPAPFAPQQVWASAFGIGIILISATWIQGLGGHILIAKDIIDPIAPGGQGSLVPALINMLSDGAPIMVGILAVCALAAMQSTGAAYMSTASGMLTRDIYKHLFFKELSHSAQKLIGRISVILIVGAALTTAIVSTDALVLLGGLAVAYGFQMWPALIAVCYCKWLTREGIVTGLILGLIAVTVTYVPHFGLKYNWTIHSAGWGIFFNLGSAILVSMFTQPSKEEDERKAEHHRFLTEYAGLTPSKRKFIPFAWGLVIVWFLCAIGPLTPILGNTSLGDPFNPSTWLFGLPSLWTWAIIWWVIGVFMMWFLAYYMEMSTNIKGTFEGIDDYADQEGQKKAPVRMNLESP
ncbi:MAG: sodium:solute symporter family protein [Nitrospinota bacterium]